MIEKIKEIINPTDDQQYKRYIQNFRKKHVPKRFNQLKLLDELNNPEIDHFISISNRTDGKSFNYVHALLNIAIDYDLGLFLLSRNMMLRTSYQTLIEEVIDKSTVLDRKHFTFIRQQYYVTLNYKERTIAVISDLNNATELKYFSNYLKNFPIMIYDEFLVLETDYLPDEWLRLKTIYESIDRVESYPLIHKPKIFYLGNAVNFSSPVLSGLKLFNILENHPMDSAKVYQYDFNIMLELHKNEQANEQRNTRAFGGGNDSMTTAQFKTNSFSIANENDRNRIKRNPRHVYVKLDRENLKITFNRDTFETLLSIEGYIDEPYQYNLLLKDKRKDSIFLTEKYFSDKQIKKYDRGRYLFDNNYSKNFITNDYNHINRLKISKIIREIIAKETPEKEFESKEKQFKENYIEQTKRSLMEKMFGGTHL